MPMVTKLIRGCDIPQRAPANKFTWPFNEVFMWDHMAKKTHHISTCRRPMDINQTRQGADFQWEAPIFKAAWPFDHVTNVRSLDNLENWYFLYHKINSQWTWKCANFRDEAQHTNANFLLGFKWPRNGWWRAIRDVKSTLFPLNNTFSVVSNKFFCQYFK